jgi:cation transport regulator ChaC
MDYAQMRERCPSAEFVCVAKLQNHKLTFSRYSDKREGGVADAISEQGQHVWGVVYRISDTDLRTLDRREGLGINAYVRRATTVNQDGDESIPLEAEIYYAIPQDGAPFHPSQTYKGLIVSGANHWKLPANYIAELENIKVSS